MELVVMSDVDGAYRQLEQRLRRGAKAYPDFTLLTPQGAEQHTAYWHPREGFWVVLERAADESKYWCSYGTRDPALAPSQRYVVQINVQRTGNLWVTAGVLAHDAGRHVYLLHSGSLGGSAGAGFADWYHGPRATLRWSNGSITSRFVIGRLDEGRFLALLGAYIKHVEYFKGGGRAHTLESYYRNAIAAGVDAAVERAEEQVRETSLATGAAGVAAEGEAPVRGARGGGEVARIRLGRLQQLQGWLLDDPELLQTAIDTLTSKAEADRRRRLVVSACGAALSILAGWLLSAVRPDGIFTWFAAVLGR